MQFKGRLYFLSNRVQIMLFTVMPRYRIIQVEDDLQREKDAHGKSKIDAEKNNTSLNDDIKNLLEDNMAKEATKNEILNRLKSMYVICLRMILIYILIRLIARRVAENVHLIKEIESLQ